MASTAEAVRECFGRGRAAIAGKLAGEAHEFLYWSGIQDARQCDSLPCGQYKPPSVRGGKLPDQFSTFSARSGWGSAVFAQSLFLPRNQPLQNRVRGPAGRKTWDYFFFVDFLGHSEDDGIRDALKELEEAARTIESWGVTRRLSPERMLSCSNSRDLRGLKKTLSVIGSGNNSRRTVQRDPDPQGRGVGPNLR